MSGSNRFAQQGRAGPWLAETAMMACMDPEGWNERYAGSELLWTARPNRFLASEVADLPPGRALDLGCGEGRPRVT